MICWLNGLFLFGLGERSRKGVGSYTTNMHISLDFPLSFTVAYNPTENELPHHQWLPRPQLGAEVGQFRLILKNGRPTNISIYKKEACNTRLCTLTRLHSALHGLRNRDINSRLPE